MSARKSIKNNNYNNNYKPTAASRARDARAARAAVYSSNRAPPASRGFTPLASGWHYGRGIQGETKAVDLATASYSFALNAALAGVGLNFIAAGSSFFNRIGRKVALKSLYVNGSIISTGGNANYAPEYLRYMVVYDSQTNGASPLWSDVIQSTTQNNANSNLVKDGFNLNNRDRFKILIDKRLPMPGTLASGAAEQPPYPTSCELLVQEFRSLNNLETQFKADSTPAVIGDLATGGLFFMIQGDTGGQWSFNGTFRVRYTDN